MAPSNNGIRTLGDLTGPEYSAEIFRDRESKNGSKGARCDDGRPNSNPLAAPFCQPTKSDGKGGSIPVLCHIPNLSSADKCKAMLQRIHAEFEPIVRERGYRVLSVSEMCCCADGLDSEPTANGRKRTKRRKQPSNVLGYNMTRFSRPKTHTIHLRLRDPRNHERLFEYEDVAGTMAHELAHCVHQNHGKEFYKLMEEILEQHASRMVESNGFFGSGGFFGGGRIGGPSTAPPQPVPTTGGNRLGGKSGTGRNDLHPNNPRNGGVGSSGVGHRLGGGNVPKHLIRNAAAQAAEHRRRQMERIRRAIEKSTKPCVIELLSDDENDDTYNQPNRIASKRPRAAEAREREPIGKNQRSKAKQRHGLASANLSDNSAVEIIEVDSKPPARPTRPPAQGCVIDLTSNESEIENIGAPSSGAFAVKSWNCRRCTFSNRSQSRVCEMCHSKKE